MSTIRRLLTSVLLLSLLAACSGGAPQPTQPAANTQETPGAISGGEFHGAFPYKVPPEGYFNSFAPNGLPSLNGITIYWNLMEMPGAMYRWGDRTWVPMMAERWEVRQPDTFVLHLRKG